MSTKPESEGRSAGKQRAVLIVGAGRSGTSAVTRGVQSLGVDLGNDFKNASPKNPRGFFEDAALLDLNKRLRRSLGLRSDSVALIEPDAWKRAEVLEFRREAKTIVRQRFGRSPVWGFKYGRTLRLLPFWEEVLSELEMEPVYVVATRNLLNVARSRARLNPRRGRQAKSDLEWLTSVVPFFRLLRGRSMVVVDFDLLVADPAAQMVRVAHALHLTMDTGIKAAIQQYAGDFLDPRLRHNRFTVDDLERDPRVVPLARDAYLLIRRLATDELRPDSSAFWNEWEAIEGELARLAPVLGLADRLERDYLRAAWNPLGMLPAIWQLWRNFRDH